MEQLWDELANHDGGTALGIRLMLFGYRQASVGHFDFRAGAVRPEPWNGRGG
jgi:hypothetical protein